MCRFAAHGSFLPVLAALFVVAAGAGFAAPLPVVDSAVDGQAQIVTDPEDPVAYEAYGRFLLDKSKSAQAAKILETGRIKAHASAELLVLLAEAYQAQDQLVRAESTTRQALALDPECVSAHLRMGEIYFKMGWPKSGLVSFREAIALAPEQTGPKVKLLGGLMEAGMLTDAENKCLEFISTGGQEPELWLALGKIFEKQEKPRAAFTTYGQALVLDAENAPAYARQGKLFCQFGQFEAAESSCRKALEIDPDLALAHGYLGIACSYLGNPEEARKHAALAEAAGLNMLAVWKKIGQ